MSHKNVGKKLVKGQKSELKNTMISISLMLTLLVCLCGCEVKNTTQEISSIIYQHKIYGVITNVVTLDFKTDMKDMYVNSDVRKGGAPMRCQDIPMRDIESSMISNPKLEQRRLAELAMDQWEGTYTETMRTDHSEWRVIIYYKDKSKQVISGIDSDTPESYNKLLALLLV